MTHRTLSKWFLIAAFVFGMSEVMAARLKDMAVVSGLRPNQLIGYGLVVGLDGTGDNSGANPVTGQSVITCSIHWVWLCRLALICKHAMPLWSW
jgi:flagellar P-ring protein precursor FlgI